MEAGSWWTMLHDWWANHEATGSSKTEKLNIEAKADPGSTQPLHSITYSISLLP